MEITFCGGAGEVGASCFLLNLDNKKILLDCGIRMTSGKDALPDFSLIQQQGGVDAIFISHAHLDHIGSLPIISREYPNAPIYMTHATKDLVRVLLYDSLRIMGEQEVEIPIYAEIHVVNMLNRIVCFSPEFEIRPFSDSDINVTFFHAGHIAGASCIYIQSGKGSFFYSGDISLTNQYTVSGAVIPRLRPDAAVIESTYGDKLHANRQVEEDRLIDMVNEIAANGGKILIPAFALGRSQEIILILKRAMSKGKLANINVYIDGMVREICRVYKLNPNYLRNTLSKKIWKGKDIFFDDHIKVVDNKDMRLQIVESGDPCCIISSSGMLTGGPSQWYAEKLAGDDKNFIAITGYQDEESPGRALSNLMELPPEDRILLLGDKKIPVKCQLGKYNLSAHADKGEILSLVHALTPKRLFLVHGDHTAMTNLGMQLQAEIRGRVFLPCNGDKNDIYTGKPRKQISKRVIPSLNNTSMLKEDNVEALWNYILESGGATFAFTAEQIIEIWGSNLKFTEKDIKDTMDVLISLPYFEPDIRRPFLFRPVPKDMLSINNDGIMEVNKMLTLAEEFFPSESGLYKKGARFDEKIVILYFNFPKKAIRIFDNKIKEFEMQTGWTVEVNREYNLDAVENALYKVLSKDARLIGKVSYYRLEEYIKISLDNSYPGEVINQICEKFNEITGLNLIITDESKADPYKPVSASDEQMEQNKAFALIENKFDGKHHKLYKKGLKQDENGAYIELSFISPEIGIRYNDTIFELISQTGWNIKINPNPNQNDIIKYAKRLLQDRNIYTKKNPSVYQDIKSVKIIPVQQPEDNIVNEIKSKFKEDTGYELVF